MKFKVFTVFDSKVQAFNTPFFQRSTGEALRAWSDAVNNSDQGIMKHPEDYTLFELGEYCDDNAKFEMYETPRSLGLAVEFVKPVKKEGM